ncbi:MAG TPA: serine hydrolase domain-containing protein [Streptosporangiaceae bacterium]|nr:serine hydrolase domain-containing protein [Streptosporangiaceae bacterium]
MTGQTARVVRQAVAAGQIPGAVFAAGAPGQPAEVVVAGHAQLYGGPRREMRRDTVFDVASLTKVVATLPAVLRLASLGEIALEDRVVRFLPCFHGEGRELVTVRHLLAHTSGLPAEVPYWRRCDGPEEIRRAIPRTALTHPPGRRVIYSDVGFLLLGLLVEAITAASLDVSVAELVTGPLEMTRTGFRVDAAGVSIAATELQPDGSALTGVVHDENARALGGVAGHAGLFAPAGDLARYLERAWLGPAGEFLSAASRRTATRLQTDGLGGRRGLGWVLRGDAADFLGRRWPRGSLSHTGFTGTCLAGDPASGAWAVLLTNDIHYGRGRGVIQGVREAVFDAWADRFGP